MRLAAFLMLMLCLVTADARDVYRWVAPDGSVYYSDNPRAGADRITLPEWLPPQPRYNVPPPSPGRAGKPVLGVYKGLTIVKPESGDNVHDNQGNVEVTLAVEPDLNTTAGHKIRILLDGQAQGDPLPSLEQSLRGVERGRHTVAAQVIDVQGRVLINSRPVTFFLKHASPLFHPPRPGTPYKGVQQAPRAPMAPRAPRAPHAPFRPAVPPPPPPPKPPPSQGGGSGAP
jgi:hypothetical protein